jgi:phage terminase large subunit-like protein
MGKRGPGAKPVDLSAPQGRVKSVRRQKLLAWQQDGLTRAERVIAFIETLKVTSGIFAGQNFLLREWQKAIVRGIYDPIGDDGRRLVRTALVTMGRKNGKTGLAAALCLAHLAGPEAEQRGQIFSAAADRDQAALIFREMEAFIFAEPTLRARCNVQRFAKKIEDTENGSTYQAMSSDARKAHGLSPSLIICDELAQWHDRALFDNLVTGTGARREPLLIAISTTSSDPNHVMSELTVYGRQVAEGVIVDRTFAAFIFEVPITDDPWNEENWKKANPALGDFRDIDEMRAAASMARRLPARESAFKNLYLNQPCDPDQRFIAGADWRACTGAIDPEALRSRPCWAGLDLSSTRDLTALVLFFPEDGGAILPFFWVPGDNLLDREERDRVPYRVWRDQGFLEAPAGRAIDRRAIACRIAEIASAFDVRGMAYDRWRIEDLKKILADEGIDLPLIDWGQGFQSMGPAVDSLEVAIIDRHLKHGGNPILSWNIANCVVETDAAGARKISKSKSTERVDGAVALAMAVGLHSRSPQTFLDFDRPLVLSA